MGILWPVSHNCIMGSGVLPIKVTYFFKLSNWPVYWLFVWFHLRPICMGFTVACFWHTIVIITDLLLILIIYLLDENILGISFLKHFTTLYTLFFLAHCQQMPHRQIWKWSLHDFISVINNIIAFNSPILYSLLTQRTITRQ